MAHRPTIADLARVRHPGQRFLSPEIILAQSLRRVFIKPGRVNLSRMMDSLAGFC